MRRIVQLIVVLLAGCAAEARPQALFVAAPSSPVTVGEGPGWLLTADLNRDGNVDVVTNHQRVRRVAVHLGDGRGGFEAAPGSPIHREYTPGDVALGDVNGDRFLDLAVSSSERDQVEIFLGDGTGAFRAVPGAPIVMSASAYGFTRFVQLVDLNGDGRLDLVTATDGRDGDDTPSVMLGDGRGGFTPGPALKLETGGGHYAFDFGDLDGDGHLDLVTAARAAGGGSRAGRVVVQRGDGRGGFEPGASVSVPPGPRLASLADVNGDRRLDVVLSHGETPQLTVLLNGGGGALAPAPGSPYAIETQAFSVLVADANRDSRPDLLAATVQNQAPPYESGLTVLLGDGRGFAPAPGSPFRTGPGSYRIALADVDGDGKQDVLASSGAGDSLTVLLGR